MVQPFSRKWHLKLLFLVVFRIFPNWNCHFRPGLWKAGCGVVRLYVLQSYRSCTFCKRKTRGETQFRIELAVPCTLANHNEINCNDTLPFIIFLTSISCNGLNRLWRQCLLLSPCPLWRHKQTLFGVIQPLTGGKCRTFRRVIVNEQFLFSSISLLSLHILRSGFLYIVFYKQSDHIVLNCIHSNSTLSVQFYFVACSEILVFRYTLSEKLF